ncbi:MAG: hypothetical protein AAFV59_04865 [Pseudomonadota bacterium]
MLRALACALALTSAFSAAAFASGLKAVQTADLVKTIIDADGAEIVTFEPATDVEPGEQVRYSLQYVNEGAEPAQAVSLVMPVPAEMILVEGSVKGGASSVTYSTDAGETFASRDEITVADGEIERTARAEDITHIKWAFATPIAPAESGSISFVATLK